MNRLTLLFVFMIFTQTLFSQNWVTVHEPAIRVLVRSMEFTTLTDGWMVGGKGFVYRTQDGGYNWQQVDLETEKELYKVFFSDPQNGWIGTGGGTIFRTIDGGNNWTEISFVNAVPPMVFTYFDAIHFNDANVGHITAGKLRTEYLLRTEDGGLTWTVKDSLISQTLSRRWYAIDFYNGTHGVAAGDNREIQRYSHDGGVSWNPSANIVDNFFRDLRVAKVLNQNDMVILGDGNEFSGVPTPIYRSTNGGMNWSKVLQTPINNYDRVRGLYFRNENEGIGVGSNGFSKSYFTTTTNAGVNWFAGELDFSFSFQGISGIGDNLFVLGTGSHLIKSSNFGEDWEYVSYNAPSPFYSIKFKNGKGYALNLYSNLFISEDGSGDEWTFVSHAGSEQSYAMEVLDENNIVILKENRKIVKSSDGGLTWSTKLEALPFNARNRVGGLSFPDPNTGYAWVSINDYGNYYVFKSTDAGDTWEQVLVTGGPGSLSGNAGFFDANTGVLAGPGRWILRTSDGGATWEQPELVGFPGHTSNRSFQDVFVVNENKAWAVGNKMIALTVDKGATWTFVEHGIADIDSAFRTVAFYNDTLGYIGCGDGLVIKTTDSGITWEIDETFPKEGLLFFTSAFNEEGRVFLGTAHGELYGTYVEPPSNTGKDLSANPSRFELGQNYPNPFNPSTIISYQIHSKNHVILKVYDLLGREIATLVNKVMDAGKHIVEFNTNNLQLNSGVFFYRLKAGDFVDTKKMILMR